MGNLGTIMDNGLTGMEAIMGRTGFANDIIVVQRSDGSFGCSAVDVRFKDQVTVPNWTKENVTIAINGREINDFALPLNRLISKNDIAFHKEEASSKLLASMRLHLGINNITFTLKFRGNDGVEISQGIMDVVHAEARIFLWNCNARVAVTDVDGTITKSDKRGFIMRQLGLDWTQDGVAEIFSRIKENGYEVLYLCGRPRFEAKATRNYLSGVKQKKDGHDWTLPKGPVIITPDRFFDCGWREVWGSQADEFKIPYLQDIRKLFPDNHNPFHAGFGNRNSDRKKLPNFANSP